MLIDVRLTEKDFIAAQRLHFRPKPILRGATYLLIAVVTVMLATQTWTIVNGGVLPRGWWILPAGLAYGAFLFFLLLPWRILRIFRQNPALAAPTCITIEESGLFLDSSRGQLRFGWPMIKRWKTNQEMILVYHSSSHFHILPRRCFTSSGDFDRLRELLSKQLGSPQA